MKRFLPKLKRHWLVWPILLIGALVFWQWLHFDYLTHGDWPVWTDLRTGELFHLSAWRSDLSLGRPNLLLWRAPLYAAHAWLAQSAGLTLHIAERFIVFFPIIFLLPLSGYLVTYQATKSRLAGFVGSLIFAYNTYFLAISSQGHILITLAFVFATLSFWGFMLAQSQKSSRLAAIGAIFAGLMLAVSGYSDFRVTYIFSGVLLLYAIWPSGRQCGYRRAAWTFPLTMAITGSLHAFWLIGMRASGSLSSNTILDRGLFGDQFWNLSAALALFHPFWNGSRPRWFQLQFVDWWFWLLPLAAWAGLYLARKNRRAAMYGLIALIGIFLSKQAEAPFQDFYLWAFKNVPGFNAFREATKFYILTVLAYAVMAGIFLSELKRIGERAKGGWRRWLYPGAALVLTLLLLSNALPVVGGKMETLYVKKYRPMDSVIWAGFQKNHPEWYRVSEIPFGTGWQFGTDYHPTEGRLDLMSHLKRIDPAANIKGLGKTLTDRLIAVYDRPDTGHDLALYGIKYVLIHGGLTRKDGLRAVEAADRQPWLTRLDIGLEDTVAYEVANARPLIYLTAEPESLEKDVPFRPVEFESTYPTRYDFLLTGISEPTYLHLAYDFNRNWRLYHGSPEQSKGQRQVGQGPNVVNFSSFLIDPATIGDDTPGASRNADGSWDLRMSIYYQAQGQVDAAVALGKTVAALSVLAMLVLAAWPWLRRRSAITEQEQDA